MAGLFITFEGGDGSGKSTQADLLAQWLEEQNRTVVRTREPGGTELGSHIRDLVLHHRGDIDSRSEALLYAADRAQHVATVVRPALEMGSIVIQDRYFDSSIAYQGAGRVLDAQEIRNLSLWASKELIPDVTIVLDLDQSVARHRLEAEDKPFDRLENEKAEFHERVREGFLALAAAEPERFLVVDATLPIGEISEIIRGHISPLLA